MKKWIVGLMAMVLVLGITACGKDKEDGGNTANGGSTDKVGAVNSQTVPTLEELLTKSADASKDLKSLSMDAEVNQDLVITQGDQKQEQKIIMKIASDIIKDPMQLVQEIKMTLPGQSDTDMKQYVTEDGVFVNVGGVWSKQPDETRDELLASMEDSANPQKQLEQFKTISKDTKITAEGDEYVLTADVSGDAVKDLAKELMSQSGGKTEEVAAMIEQMNIKSIKITSAVNKDTYLATRANVNLVMEMEQEGSSISMNMVMKSTFSKYNEISEIKVPQEALDSVK